MIDITTWDEFVKWVGGASDATYISVKQEKYPMTYISFYNDGIIWAGNTKGSCQIYKNAPFQLMYDMLVAKDKEIKDTK